MKLSPQAYNEYIRLKSYFGERALEFLDRVSQLEYVRAEYRNSLPWLEVGPRVKMAQPARALPPPISERLAQITEDHFLRPSPEAKKATTRQDEVALEAILTGLLLPVTPWEMQPKAKLLPITGAFMAHMSKGAKEHFVKEFGRGYRRRDGVPDRRGSFAIQQYLVELSYSIPVLVREVDFSQRYLNPTTIKVSYDATPMAEWAQKLGLSLDRDTPAPAVRHAKTLVAYHLEAVGQGAIRLKPNADLSQTAIRRLEEEGDPAPLTT